MTEERLNEITRAMQHSPLHWAMRWCDANECACLGCADTATRVGAGRSVHPEFTPHAIPRITKAEWQEWWRVQGQRLGNPEAGADAGER